MFQRERRGLVVVVVVVVEEEEEEKEGVLGEWRYSSTHS
jgi:hypothetical protein